MASKSDGTMLGSSSVIPRLRAIKKIRRQLLLEARWAARKWNPRCPESLQQGVQPLPIKAEFELSSTRFAASAGVLSGKLEMRIRFVGRLLYKQALLMAWMSWRIRSRMRSCMLVGVHHGWLFCRARGRRIRFRKGLCVVGNCTIGHMSA